MAETERKRRDEALFDDPAFLRAPVENTTEGLLTIDSESQIVFANPAIEDILGYPPEELIGSSKMKIIPERLRNVHAGGLQQYLQTGEKHIDWTGVELPALDKDDHEVEVSVSLREHEYNGQRLFNGYFHRHNGPEDARTGTAHSATRTHGIRARSLSRPPKPPLNSERLCRVNRRGSRYWGNIVCAAGTLPH